MHEQDPKEKIAADSRGTEDSAGLRELIEAGGGGQESSILALTRRVLRRHRGGWLAAGLVIHLGWSALGLSAAVLSLGAVVYLWLALHVAQRAAFDGAGPGQSLVRGYSRAIRSLFDGGRWRSPAGHGAADAALGGVVRLVGAYALAWGLFFGALVTATVIPLFPLLVPFPMAMIFALAAAPSLTWWCLHDLASSPVGAPPALSADGESPA